MSRLQTSPDSPVPVRQIANLLTQYVGRLNPVWIEGQVAQLSLRPGIQTAFLTLRDPLAEISMKVTCARQLLDSMPMPLQPGASVVMHAQAEYYAPRGELQFRAIDIRPVGLGELLARLERRRQLLAAEGLFDPALKRPIPFLPTAIGLVTASGSAAERDVVENARRRWPGVRIEIAYAAMQGPRSAGEVIDALARLDRHPEVDVVVVARGGGSVEDLLPFSDEALIRAVHKATTPVVSAIGHEPDSPLLDLVADVRASTPTDAAKRVVPDVTTELQGLATARQRLRAAVAGWLSREQAGLDAVRSRPVLADPGSTYAARSEEIALWAQRGRRALGHRLDRAGDDIAHARARARALSPLETLKRGYAVLQSADGHVLTSVDAVDAGAALTVRVADGRVHATADRAERLDERDDEDGARR